jgi:hypothetical protein
MIRMPQFSGEFGLPPVRPFRGEVSPPAAPVLRGRLALQPSCRAKLAILCRSSPAA